MVSGASGAQALADLSSALTVAATCLEDVAHTAARGAARLIGDCAAIRLTDEQVTAHHPDDDRFAVLGRLSPENLQPDVFGPATDGHTWREALGGGPPRLLLHRPGEDELRRLAPRVPPQLLDRVHVTSLLFCPLVADDEYHGYLVLARATAADGYAASDVDLATEVAVRTAGALATARTVQRLRASEERYRHIVETTLDGVWEIDGDAATTFVNARMANLLGVPRSELAGRSMRDFLDAAGKARLDNCRDGRSEVFDCRLVRPGEAPLWVQISAAPRAGSAGQLAAGSAGLLCIVSDITERVAARDARRQLDQLRRQDAIGQLAGGIAHDFNNLLMLISGSAELLTEELEPGSDNHRLAAQIVTSAARGSELSHQLLTFGRRSPHVHKVLVTPLLEGVHQVLARAFGDQVTLQLRPEPDLWAIHADRGQLEQALVNLATNAREAMNRGGVITIAASNVVVREGDLSNAAIAGRFVCVSVSDTGAGMDPDIREHAFDPSYTTKSARGAAGMGLATVRSIITASGGHVALESEPRIGTTVRLYLPVTDELNAAPPGVQAQPDRTTGHILVVEDQPELAHLIRYLLQPAGYTVTIATDAADALSVMAAGLVPDLLLTDVVMPRMTGPELAEKIRTGNPGLKVLYMSGYTAAVLAPEGHGDVGAALLQKPFNRHTLLTAVAKALGT